MTTQPQPSFDELVNSAVANVMAILNGASESDLKELHDDTDDTRLDALIADVATLKSMNTEREMFLAQNKSLAEWNLSQEPKLNAAKQRVKEIYEQTQKLQNEVSQQKRKLDAVGQSRNLDTTLALMQAAASEAEETSETTAADFTAGDMAVDHFLGKYIEQRQLAHARRVRCEKLSEMLLQQRQGYGQGAPSPAHRIPPSNQQQGWGVPTAQTSTATPYPQLGMYR